MSWILDHIQICIAIAVMIAAWVKKLRDASAKKASKQNPASTRANTSTRDPRFDAEAAERTRKIQEEIRRKIDERTRRAQPSRSQAAPSSPRSREYDPFTPEALQGREPAEMPRPPALPPRLPSTRDANLARKLEAARQREEKRKAKASSAAREDSISIQVAPIALIPSAGASLPIHPLRETLTNPEEVRRAIVLSEILQPPVGLR